MQLPRRRLCEPDTPIEILEYIATGERVDRVVI